MRTFQPISKSCLPSASNCCGQLVNPCIRTRERWVRRSWVYSRVWQAGLTFGPSRSLMLVAIRTPSSYGSPVTRRILSATICSVDVERSPDQLAVRELCRDFAKEVVAPAAGELDRNHRFGYDIVQRMGELGLFGLPFSPEYGGAGADFLSLCLAIEEISRADGGVGITLEAAVCLGASPIHDFGSAEQKQRWLPDLLAGKKLWAFGLTEPEAGSGGGGRAARAEQRDGH